MKLLCMQKTLELINWGIQYHLKNQLYSWCDFHFHNKNTSIYHNYITITIDIEIFLLELTNNTVAHQL